MASKTLSASGSIESVCDHQLFEATKVKQGIEWT